MFDILKWNDTGCACKKMRCSIFYDRYEILGYNTVTEKSVIFFKIMRPIEIELCINFFLQNSQKSCKEKML